MELLAFAGGAALGIGAGMIIVWRRLRRERRAWFEEADRLSIRLIRAECAERTPVRAVVERGRE